MISMYFKIVWWMLIVNPFYGILNSLYLKIEGLLIKRLKKLNVPKEEATKLSNKEFNKKFKKLFHWRVKVGIFQIKRLYLKAKSLEADLKGADLLYEFNRTVNSMGFHIPFETPPLELYLETKSVYEKSVNRYNLAIKNLDDYIETVYNIVKPREEGGSL